MALNALNSWVLCQKNHSDLTKYFKRYISWNSITSCFDYVVSKEIENTSLAKEFVAHSLELSLSQFLGSTPQRLIKYLLTMSQTSSLALREYCITQIPQKGLWKNLPIQCALIECIYLIMYFKDILIKYFVFIQFMGESLLYCLIGHVSLHCKPAASDLLSERFHFGGLE